MGSGDEGPVLGMRRGTRLEVRVPDVGIVDVYALLADRSRYEKAMESLRYRRKVYVQQGRKLIEMRRRAEKAERELAIERQAAAHIDSHWISVPGVRGSMSQQVAELSQWVDDGNVGRDPEAQMWHRVVKVGEEAGEVIDEMIMFVGGNPRKDKSPDDSALVKELLDAAVAALGGVEHLRGNDGSSFGMLADHLAYVHGRAMAAKASEGGKQPPEQGDASPADGPETAQEVPRQVQVPPPSFGELWEALTAPFRGIGDLIGLVPATDDRDDELIAQAPRLAAHDEDGLYRAGRLYPPIERFQAEQR